jgi:hypothetical protein
MNRILLANAIGRKPASSAYKDLLSSSFKYGLTLGNEKSDMIELTPLGVALTKPRDTSERAASLRKAAMNPDLFGRLYNHYNNGKLPQGTFFLSVLERDFEVPRERSEECAGLLIENGRLGGIIRELQGTMYVILDGEPVPPQIDTQVEKGEGEESDVVVAGDDPTLTPPAPIIPPVLEAAERFIFLGHGKNRKPLEQLRKVLDQFGVKYKVAIDEPQGARPISVKVADVMRGCYSAVLIFTSDEEFSDKDGNTVWRPSENVVYELGAASILYDNRIVIFKEDGVDFPTNFHDIGHISFDKDRLDAKGLDLVKELVGLKLLKVQPA